MKLRRCVTGRISQPEEVGYELAMPWNRAATVRPLAVVAVDTARDVAEVLRFAADHGLRVAVQSTGHGGVSVGSDMLLVHTGRLQQCTVDAARRCAHVGAGVTWQQLLHACRPHGLAPVTGSALGVGVVGYLSGGGVGPLVRGLGLSSDYVRAFEVVTGDGVPRDVNSTSDPELFWGLRGAKSLLGIVTGVEIELLPITEIYAGALYFEGTAAAQVLPAWHRWSAGLPPHATTSVAVVHLPPSPALPPALAGQVRVAVRYASLAEPSEAEEEFAPMRRVAPPVFGNVHQVPYADLGGIHADPTRPTSAVGAGALLGKLTTQVIDALVELAGGGATAPQTLVEVRQLGGALDRAPQHDSAYCFRSLPYHLFVTGPPTPVSEAGRSEAGLGPRWQKIMAAAAPHAEGRLVNFADPSQPSDIRQSYDDRSLARLGQLAARVDPLGVLSGALRTVS